MTIAPPDTPPKAHPAAAPLDLREIKFDPRWALRAPPSLLVRRRLLPLLAWEGEFHVAAAGPIDAGATRYLERLAGLPVRPVAALPESIRSLQTRLFGDLNAALALNHAPAGSPGAPLSAQETDSDDMVALCDRLIGSAILRGASDLHFNVHRDGGVRVRIRAEGALEDYMAFSKDQRVALLNRLKVMARMDIAEKRAPQDGGFRFETGHGMPPIEVRAAAIPTRHGERLTLRLLGVETGALTLDRLGMTPPQLALFERAVNLPHGMVLLTGPTGSGKSTTLYAALRHLMAGRPRNIMTVEDPVEYDIEGVSQTEVDTRADKVSFLTSLRSILRHDPDVIMVGEIRDRETADLAVRASLTGHLVLSTLHTNTAAGAVTRLIDLGIDRFLIASVLRLAAAQRLVRRLCPHCRKQRPLHPGEAALLGCPAETGAAVWEAGGCLRCAGGGTLGRMGLFELLPVESGLSARIGSGPLDSLERDLRNLAARQGHPTLLQDGLDKLRQGGIAVADLITATMEF